jgi:Nuclease-related domain
MIPAAPVEGSTSTAERRLFERVHEDTAEELVAFHSVAWLVPGERGRPQQGEADFVLAHPEHGVVVLEVKGGGIRYDAASGKWFSSGKEGENEIKDPARQAQRTSHLLRRSLARARRGGGEQISIGYAVAFPDTRADLRQLRPEIPRDIVVDHGDLSRLQTKLDAIFRYWHGRDDRPPPGADGMRLLESVLANSFELRAPLAYEYEDERRELLTLTEQQYRMLDLLSRHPRAAIAGCAGSGKTFLAAEKARRLAAQGFRVLVLA